MFILKQKKEITFIESKFSETPPKTIKLAEAYYNTNDIYHITTKKKDSNDYETRKLPINIRYHEKSQIAELFVNFYNKYIGKETDKNEWFDFSQEMKHIFGIVFYTLENKELIGNRKINFFNIVYHFDDYKKLGNNSISNLANKFVSDANNLVKEIFNVEKISNTFNYEIKFVQEELKENKFQIAYGSEKTVEHVIKETFLINFF